MKKQFPTKAINMQHRLIGCVPKNNTYAGRLKVIKKK